MKLRLVITSDSRPDKVNRNYDSTYSLVNYVRLLITSVYFDTNL